MQGVEEMDATAGSHRNTIALSMNRRENIICWDCRGAKRGGFLRKIKEMIRAHQPMVIVLLEPRIGREVAGVICKKGGKVWIHSEADGFNGGIWMFWD